MQRQGEGRRSRWRMRAALISLTFALGCDPATQLLVVVDSDLEAGTELSVVEITVGSGVGLVTTHAFDLNTTGLPFTFGVRPARDADEGVHLSAAGRNAEGEFVVGRSAQTNFLSGRTLRLDLPLARACVNIELDCEAGMTCGGGECVGSVLQAAELTDIDPDTAPPQLFDRPSPTTDAGHDAGDEEDAGPPCVEDAPCDTGNPCQPGRMRCEGAPLCEPGEPLSVGTDCGSGRVCLAGGTCG